MQRYIGLDVHKATCALVVLNEGGKRIKQTVVATEESKLVDIVKRMRGRKVLCFEDGVWSQWLSEIMTPHVAEIVIPKASIKKRGASNDLADAYELAESARRSVLSQTVVKAPPEMLKLKSCADAYRLLTRDSTRAKNRIHAVFRSRGVATTTGSGSPMFRPKLRDEWLQRLPEKLWPTTLAYFGVHDALITSRAEIKRELVQEAKSFEGFRFISSVPGLGDIRSAQLLAIVITPHRFRTKRQFWRFSGLAVATYSSADWSIEDGRPQRTRPPLTRGLVKQSNRQLKAIFVGAAFGAITRFHPEVRSHYDALIAKGIKSHRAKLTIARKLAAITLRLWKNKEVYVPERFSPQT